MDITGISHGRCRAETWRSASLDHVAFSVADRKDLDAWSERFAELGVTHSPVADTPRGQVLCFRDPDDIQLELFWFPHAG